jgi:hypothetical protein
MTNVADYTIIQESALKLPKTSGDIDQEIEFDAPGVDDGEPAIFMLRVAPDGTGANLEAAINGNEVVDVQLDDDVKRTFHVVVPAEVLQASGNELTLRVKGAGAVTMQHMALLYKAAA